MKLWMGLCIILSPVIILPGVMNGWIDTSPVIKLTQEQKEKLREAYEGRNYFSCSDENDSSGEDSGCKNQEIITNVVSTITTESGTGTGDKSKDKK